MKKLFSVFAGATLVLTVGLLLHHPRTHAAFQSNVIIDDSVFNVSSMTAAQIDAFLNTFPNSCISPNSGFQAKVPSGYTPTGGYAYGAFGTAGQVIYTSAQVYGLNPQVLLATLQKEQSLVAGGGGSFCNNGDENKYSAAVGYGCPDSGTVHQWTGISLYMRSGVEHTDTGSTCVNTAIKAGFSQQVIRAAWLLKFGQQRALGNTAWAVVTGSWDNSDDPLSCYSGPITQGNYKRCSSGTAVYYDGYTTIDGIATHMDTGATAALYWYTPHFHGNQSFVTIFEGWFGSTISSAYYQCHNASNILGAGSGVKALKNHFYLGKIETVSLSFLNNTGSKCLEVHTWNPGYQTWYNNIATNHPAVDPADNAILSGNTTGDARSDMIFVKYRNTGSGKVEIHTWDPSYQHWDSNIATNHPAVDPADNEVISADLNGDGRDELIFIKYRNTQSGKIEIHTWNPGYQTWSSNIATNHPAIDPLYNRVIAADVYGEGRDRLMLVKYGQTGSGKIEIHTWNPGYQTWYNNIATNHPSIDSTYNNVIAADVYGEGRDRLMLVKYGQTGSGKIEIHTWNPGYQTWYNNIATNLSQL